MQAGNRSINDIFNQNKILEIPFFQRAYVWNIPQWERFVVDMEFVSKNNKPYFLGSLILKQKPTNSGQSIGDVRTVIDGQQRLTTLNLYFKVLSLMLSEPYLNTLFRLPMHNHNIALRHNHNDVEAFNRIMNFDELEEINNSDNLSNAYKYFRDNINLDKVDYRNILTNIMFVGVDLNHDDDEQQIFDTINSLGVKLTTAELLKNYFFDRNDVQLYHDHWQIVFEPDIETRSYWDSEIVTGRFRRSLLDLFFYSYLQIKIQDPKIKVSTEDKIEFTKVKGLFESYKHFIDRYNINKLELISEVKEYAELFIRNFDPDVVDSELPSEPGIERLNAIIFGLENTTLIPYVLYLLKNVRDEIDRNTIFKYIESYIMRRMVCHSNTKNYNQLFGERFISNEILSADAIRTYLSTRSDKVNSIPSDSEVLLGFGNSKLINKQSAGILYFIETSIRNRNLHATAMMGLKRYSLEHVMPKKWENKWTTVQTEDDRITRNRKLLTIGNLTIITTSLNSSIRDSSWDIKRTGIGNRKGLNHYASGLDTFSQYLEEPVWDESVIDSRSDYLANKAISIWEI